MEVLSMMPILSYGPAKIAELPGDSDTSIDITLVSPGLVPETSCTLFPLLGSDYRPILIKLPKSKQRSPDKLTYDIKDDYVVTKVRATPSYGHRTCK